MKRILVTGSTGFIGNAVIRKLLQFGYEIIATSSNEINARKNKWFQEVKYIPFDLRSFSSDLDYFTFFHRPDYMIHLAWEGLPNYTQNFHLTENLPRHLSFLSNMLRNGLNDLTVTGTCLEYGFQTGCLLETLETAPSNPYAMAKDELRKSLQVLTKELDFNLKWLRLFYMYGEGQSSTSIIPQLDKALKNKDKIFNMSGGEQVRDFSHIDDIAGYIVMAMQQKKINSIINCCSGIPVTVKDFVAEYLLSTNQTIELNLGYYPYTTYEPMEFWGNATKLQEIIALDSHNQQV